MYKISIDTSSRTELIDITQKVQGVLAEFKLNSGLCVVFVPHTTAAISINENADPAVKGDLLKQINKIVPFEDNYSHLEGNSAAHIKASLIGTQVSIILEAGRLLLGAWQSIYFCEFDGPRQREIWVSIVGTGGKEQ